MFGGRLQDPQAVASWIKMAANMRSLIRATLYCISRISVASLPSTIFFLPRQWNFYTLWHCRYLKPSRHGIKDFHRFCFFSRVQAQGVLRSGPVLAGEKNQSSGDSKGLDWIPTFQHRGQGL